MHRGELVQKLFGVEAHFARHRANDRPAIDAVGQVGEAIGFERFDRADGELGSLRYLTMRQPFRLAGLSQPRSRIEQAMISHCFDNRVLVVCQNCLSFKGAEVITDKTVPLHFVRVCAEEVVLKAYDRTFEPRNA